jgi:hypothetical protein
MTKYAVSKPKRGYLKHYAITDDGGHAEGTLDMIQALIDTGTGWRLATKEE